MTIVSVDLAHRHYEDIGVAILEVTGRTIEVSFPQITLAGDPSPRELAQFLVRLCKIRGAKTLLLDGPQAWKDPNNGLEHSRLCERALNTPAKTGLPGTVKPRNYGPFVSFSVSVFDELANLGWPRYTGQRITGAHVTVEVFPLAAWRSLNLPSLPAKRKCSSRVIADRASILSETYGLQLKRAPNHDELQATVAGLVGVALAGHTRLHFINIGTEPFVKDGTYREGFIVTPSAGSQAPRKH
jgi:hypothetical protein